MGHESSGSLTPRMVLGPSGRRLCAASAPTGLHLRHPGDPSLCGSYREGAAPPPKALPPALPARATSGDSQVLPLQGIDVRIDTADLGPLALLQLPFHLLAVGILHGFDGCGQDVALSTHGLGR